MGGKAFKRKLAYSDARMHFAPLLKSSQYTEVYSPFS